MLRLRFPFKWQDKRNESTVKKMLQRVVSRFPRPLSTRIISARKIGTLPKSLCVDYSVESFQTPSNSRIASVAVVGPPNAGKSSLSNALITQRVSAVSRKVNTTRSRITGAYTADSRQLIFWDTPGVVERHFIKTLGAERRELTTAGWGAASEADVALLVVDASRGEQYWQHCAKIAKQLLDVRKEEELNTNLILVLNKSDRASPRSRILLAADIFRNDVEEFAESFGDRIFMTSAYNGRGVDDLRSALLDMTQKGDFILSEGTCHGDEDLDLVRQHLWEKLLHRVHEEIPYQCHFENDDFIELKDGGLYIAETIRVPRASTVPIVIGPGGNVIEWIRESAEKSSSQVLGREVHLRLRVAPA